MVGKAERDEAPVVKEKACQWGVSFLHLGRIGIRGFQPKYLTPYAHFLITHTAPMVQQIGGLDKFNGEALERLNDEFKKIFLRQTNCRDITDALLLLKRRELALRNKEIRTTEKRRNRPVKATCQVWTKCSDENTIAKKIKNFSHKPEISVSVCQKAYNPQTDRPHD